MAERLWLLVEDKMVEPDSKHFTSTHARTSLNHFLAQFHKVNEKSGVILVLDEFEYLHLRSLLSPGGAIAAAVSWSCSGPSGSS